MTLARWNELMEEIRNRIYNELSTDFDNTRANRIIEEVERLYPEQAEWVPFYTEDGCYQLGWECSCCHRQTSSYVRPYCDECGSEMGNFRKIMGLEE